MSRKAVEEVSVRIIRLDGWRRVVWMSRGGLNGWVKMGEKRFFGWLKNNCLIGWKKSCWNEWNIENKSYFECWKWKCCVEHWREHLVGKLQKMMCKYGKRCYMECWKMLQSFGIEFCLEFWKRITAYAWGCKEGTSKNDKHAWNFKEIKGSNYGAMAGNKVAGWFDKELNWN